MQNKHIRNIISENELEESSTISKMEIVRNADNKKKTKLDVVEFTINLDNNTIFQKQELLFEYDGGYVYQTIEIHEYDFTYTTNLYLIRVHNTYVNGNTAYLNGAKEFSQNEYTESVYMGINFSITQNYRTITSWHQKKPYYCALTPQLNQTDKILLEDNTNLFDLIEELMHNNMVSFDAMTLLFYNFEL